MGIFSRSNGRRGDTRHSAATDNTMTHSNYNNTTHDGVTYDRNDRNDRNDRHGIHGNRGTHSTRDSYDNNDNYDNRGSGRRGRRFGNRNEKRRRSKSSRGNRPLFDKDSGLYNRRPSFGTWFKQTWLDILTMAIMGAIGLGIYEANPAPTRSFPIVFQNGNTVYPEFAYPLRTNIIPIWAAALLASLIPIFIILVMQIRIKSFWDANNAIIGLLYSLIGAAVFQVFVKWLIGGLRPHFLSVCAPDPDKVAAGGNGFQSLMFTSDVCTGDQNQINDSLESMPSGHSTAAFAGFLYLYFYLNAKLKVFSNHHPAMWKLIALYAPVLGACLIAGSLTIDEFHNWYDCLAGAIIGSVFAISSYRMLYASVWDFRFNHIPLTRHTPFSYGAGPAGAGGFETAVFTRKAGWGYEEAFGGAPFDSAFGLRGMGGGAGRGGMTHNEQTVGLGSKNTDYRAGDVEHNAMTSGHNTTTGMGTTTTAGIGHHHDHGRGIGHHNDRKNDNVYDSTHERGIGHHNNRNSDGVYDSTHGRSHNPLHNDRNNNTYTSPTATTTTGSNPLTNHHNTHHNTNTGGYNTNDNTTGSNLLNSHHNTNTLGHNTHNNNSTLGGLTHNTNSNDPYDSRNNNNNNHSILGGLTHSNNNNNNTTSDPYNSYNTSSNITHPNTTHDTSILHRDGGNTTHMDDLSREGRSVNVDDNRYRSHRKSLERKALSGGSRNEPTY